MTDRIARLLSAQQDFVADASHQLRTPLTGLRLRLEEAKALADGPEAVAELDAAIGEVDRLSHTVDELLLLSREGERPLAGRRWTSATGHGRRCDRWRPEASSAQDHSRASAAMAQPEPSGRRARTSSARSTR